MSTYTVDLADTSYWPIIELAGGAQNLECDVDTDIEFDGTDISFSVTAVRVGTLNLLKSKADIHRELGREIVDIIDRDTDWQAEVIREAGYVSTSRGYGDPEAHYRQVAA